MNKKDLSFELILLAIFAVLEFLSFRAAFNSGLEQMVFWVLTAVIIVISFYRLEYGLLLTLAELFMGSMGHLFYISVVGHTLSIRMVLWSTILLAFTIKFIKQLIKDKKQSRYWQNIKSLSAWKILGALAFFIVLGLLSGFYHHNGAALIFDDFNAWLYFLLIFPILVVYGFQDEAVWRRLKLVFIAAALWLSLKTLFLLYVFTHGAFWTPDVYRWLRFTIEGEITPTTTGWPRIFIQGQSFLAIALLGLLFFQSTVFKFKEFFKKRNLLIWFLAGALLASLLLSFSRSFWLGLAVAVAFSLIVIWRQANFKKALISFLWFLSTVLASFLIIYLVSSYPYIHFRTNNFSTSLVSRADSSHDAAVVSRWHLLPILTKAVAHNLIVGQGFGATLTYISSDPRVLATHSDGHYTTYAFEWGYLDIWYKLGFLGLAAYLLLLFRLVGDGLKRATLENNYLFQVLPAGVIFLAVVNIFTPYLNHPLGIGFLILSSCFIWTNVVY